jgi:hypothetical protein
MAPDEQGSTVFAMGAGLVADAHVQVEMHGAAQQTLDLFPGSDAHGADAVAIVADHHLAHARRRYLRSHSIPVILLWARPVVKYHATYEKVLVDANAAIAKDRPANVFLLDRVRQFLVVATKELLADDLGDEVQIRLVRLERRVVAPKSESADPKHVSLVLDFLCTITRCSINVPWSFDSETEQRLLEVSHARALERRHAQRIVPNELERIHLQLHRPHLLHAVVVVIIVITVVVVVVIVLLCVDHVVGLVDLLDHLRQVVDLAVHIALLAVVHEVTLVHHEHERRRDLRRGRDKLFERLHRVVIQSLDGVHDEQRQVDAFDSLGGGRDQLPDVLVGLLGLDETGRIVER